MELLAFGGASVVWNPRSARGHGVSTDVGHDRCGNCKVLLTPRWRWNPLGVSVVDRRRGRLGGIDGGARETVEARSFNNSAAKAAPLYKEDGVIPAAKEYHRNRSRLAAEVDVVDRDTPQPGDMFITPRQTGRVGGVRAGRRVFDEEDYATANLRHSQQKPAVNMRAGAPSALTRTAMAAIPLLLIAPVVGFIARCVVDYIHAHIEQEVSKRFAVMESWQSRQTRRRPRVKRWQTILDEDREEDELEPATTTAVSEYQYQRDPWSTNARKPTTSKDSTVMDTWHEKETEEDRKLRQRYDYEQLKRSYTRLEPMYEKFLADSGLSASGYWRGASES